MCWWIKSRNLKNKKTAVTYLQGKCSLVTWEGMKSSASARHHMKVSIVPPLHEDTLSFHSGNNKVENPCSVSLSFQQKTNSVWLNVFIRAHHSVPQERKAERNLPKYVTQLWTNQVGKNFWISVLLSCDTLFLGCYMSAMLTTALRSDERKVFFIILTSC